MFFTALTAVAGACVGLVLGIILVYGALRLVFTVIAKCKK